MKIIVGELLKRFFCQFFVCHFPNENAQRVRRLAIGRTRFTILTLTAHCSRIAVGDCRDGVLFYTFHEVSGCPSFPTITYMFHSSLMKSMMSTKSLLFNHFHI